MSHRLYRVATGGWLITCLLIATASYAQDNREQKPETPPAQQTQERAKPSIPITITSPVRVEREKEIEPDWNKLKCSEAKSHDEADLCEQRRMAKAAEKTLELNELQVGLGFAGFLILAWTLVHVRSSTKAATAAARAAEKAVTVASETAQRQLRAYVSLEFIPDERTTFENGVLIIPLRLVNRGQTPARKTMAWRYSLIMAVNPPEENFRRGTPPERRARGVERLEISKPTIGPGGVSHARHRHRLPPVEVALLKAGHRLYVWGTIYYVDAFKRIRRTRYRLHCQLDGNERVSNLTFSSNGNDAT